MLLALEDESRDGRVCGFNGSSGQPAPTRVGGQCITGRTGWSGMSGTSIADPGTPLRSGKAAQPLRMPTNAGWVVGEAAFPLVIQVHPGDGLAGLGDQRSRRVDDRGVGQS